LTIVAQLLMKNERCSSNTVNSNLSTDSFITDNLEKAQLKFDIDSKGKIELYNQLFYYLGKF
jgi:hypothetical protein